MTESIYLDSRRTFPRNEPKAIKVSDRPSTGIPSDRSLLLRSGPPFKLEGDRILIEEQSAMAMQRFLDHFDRLTVVSLISEGANANHRFVSPEQLGLSSRVTFIGLQPGWRIHDHRRMLPTVRKTLAELIPRHRYLLFGIGGYFGDWGRVSAEEAIRQNRRYAVWVERVESSTGWVTARGLRGKAKFLVDSVPRIASDRTILPAAAVVLCQGQDTVLAYQRYNSRTLQMTNVHTREVELPPVEKIEAKAKSAEARTDLRVVYAGRLAVEKAPLEWIRAMDTALKRGCNLRATWFGDGPMRDDAQQLIAELGIGDRVRLGGLISDRAAVMEEISKADALVFTHVSREPSRILVESLNMGSPIIGYVSERAKELVLRYGGGEFSPMKKPGELGALLADIAKDRNRLSSLIRSAARQGREYSAESVFKARCEAVQASIDGGNIPRSSAC
jgi:hypothetical protein